MVHRIVVALLLAILASGLGWTGSARSQVSCPTNSASNTRVFERFQQAVAIEYGYDDKGNRRPFTTREQALVLGHALGRMANGVQENRKRQTAFACIQLALEQIYSTDLLYGSAAQLKDYRLLQEAAYGVHNAEVARISGINSSRPLRQVFATDDPMPEPEPAKEEPPVVFTDNHQDLGGVPVSVPRAS
jgi:hypothetical protein